MEEDGMEMPPNVKAQWNLLNIMADKACVIVAGFILAREFAEDPAIDTSGGATCGVLEQFEPGFLRGFVLGAVAASHVSVQKRIEAKCPGIVGNASVSVMTILEVNKTLLGEMDPEDAARRIKNIGNNIGGTGDG